MIEVLKIVKDVDEKSNHLSRAQDTV